jgi:peptide/nickel transport system permease protein
LKFNGIKEALQNARGNNDVAFHHKRLLSGLDIVYISDSRLFAVQLILPSDYISQFAMSASSSELQEFRQILGLDLPIWQRYLNWLQGLLRGELGYSFSLVGRGPAVFEVLKEVTPPTILVFGVGTALAFLLGLWLGKITGWRRPDFITGSITFGGIALYTSFPPWLAFLLVYFINSIRYLPGLLNRMLWIALHDLQPGDVQHGPGVAC